LGGKEIGRFLSAVATIYPPGDQVQANRRKMEIVEKFGRREHGRDGSGKADGEEKKSGGREGTRRTSANRTIGHPPSSK